MRRIDSATKLLRVIGNPVEHSLSPLIHNAGFEARGLDFVYLAFRVSDVASCLTGMRALPSFRGMRRHHSSQDGRHGAPRRD